MFRILNRWQEIIPPAAASKVIEILSQPNLGGAVREATSALGLQESAAMGQLQDAWQQAKSWFDSIAAHVRFSQASGTPIINGTGAIFRSEHSGIPLSLSAAEAMLSACISQPQSALVQNATTSQLISLSNAESSAVVCSVELAVILAGRLGASQKGIVLPRCSAVRWNRENDLRTLLQTAGARIIEAGAVNDCSQSDIDLALQDSGHAVITLSPNPMVSSELRRAQRDLIGTAAKKSNAISIELLFDGCFHSLDSIGVPSSVVAERLASGVDLVIVPGDRLLGGPPCGIVLGKESVMNEFSRIAATYGAFAPTMIQAGLGATIAGQTSYEQWLQLPIGAMLSNGVANLRDRARRMTIQIEGGPGITKVETLESQVAIGDRVWEQTKLPTLSLVVSFDRSAAEWLQQANQEASRAGRPTLAAELSDKQLTLHLRSIDPSEDPSIVQLLNPEIAKA